MTATLELNIDWTVFDAVQRELLQKAIDNGGHEMLAAVLYEVTPEQVIEIEKIQRQLRPREFKFESQAQQEFEVFSQEHFHDLTPQMAEEWQNKIDAEKQQKLDQLTGGVVEKSETQNMGGSNVTLVTITNDLTSVKGLGEASIKRLNAANIRSIDELRKLAQEKRQEILGPLVAHKIKTLL